MVLIFLSIMVLVWSSEAFPVGGSVGGASHARQRPMRTLQLHRQKKIQNTKSFSCGPLINFVATYAYTSIYSTKICNDYNNIPYSQKFGGQLCNHQIKIH